MLRAGSACSDPVDADISTWQKRGHLYLALTYKRLVPLRDLPSASVTIGTDAELRAHRPFLSSFPNSRSIDLCISELEDPTMSGGGGAVDAGLGDDVAECRLAEGVFSVFGSSLDFTGYRLLLAPRGRTLQRARQSPPPLRIEELLVGEADERRVPA